MQFKFKHSKINFSIKNKLDGKGFKVAFSFASQIKSLYSELIGNDPKFLVEDLKQAGNLLVVNDYIIVSLGDENKYNLAALLKSASSLAQAISTRNIKEINLQLNNFLAENLGISYAELVERFVVEFGEGLYYFDDLKTEKAKLLLDKVNLITDNEIETSISNAIAALEGLFLVRDLGNNPSNIATPTYLGKIAKGFEKLSKNVKAEIFGEKEIRALGMETFLAVAKGSKEEPCFIKLEYKGAKKTTKPIVLVGKGITFDSGGISLKPGANMDAMKYDMCGAATVLGVFAAVARQALAINLTVLVAACENMPSGHAQKPGDIVKSMSGKTIEVLNTDAEGRLILCDALHYAKQFNPDFVVDVATLTGAIIVALGNVASGLYVNDDELYQSFQKASLASGDKVWRMPLFDEYNAAIKGNHADLLNLGGWGGKAGSVTAACFLQHFTDYKWAHVDIAGTAFGADSTGNATGRPFKLLLELVRNYSIK